MQWNRWNRSSDSIRLISKGTLHTHQRPSCCCAPGQRGSFSGHVGVPVSVQACRPPAVRKGASVMHVAPFILTFTAKQHFLPLEPLSYKLLFIMIPGIEEKGGGRHYENFLSKA